MRRLLLFLFFPLSLASAQELNAGFVQGLWYSKTPLFAGDAVRIYTAIQNNSGFDIQGTVEFVVNGSAVGESSFSAIEGRIIETWTDWEVAEGNHTVGARIKDAFKLEIGKEPQPITLGSLEIGSSRVFADVDTDQDGVGNIEDADDDNDLVLDETEEGLGTDPLLADTDEDGLSDGKEVELGTNLLHKDSDQDGITDATEVAQGSNPLSSSAAKEELVARPESSFAAQVTEKVEKEVLPQVEIAVDEFVTETIEKLKEEKQKLAEKEEPLTATEQGLDLLLAAAIVALPQWQVGLVLFFAVAAALVLRRFFKEPSTER